MSRRKLKSERELVADIRKSHLTYCNQYTRCKDCDLSMSKTGKLNCELEYVKRLLIKEDLYVTRK